MQCVTCGREAGYNRAVVELYSGTELGGFCRSCEFEEFGQSLDNGFWTASEGCTFCRRDGQIALPVWECSADHAEGDIVGSVDFTVTEDTVALCDEHFHLLCGETDRPHHAVTGDPG